MTYSSFHEAQELQINKAFHPINKLGCDYLYYLSYSITDQNKSYRFCTHDNWLDFYYEENLIAADPLKRIMIDTNNTVLPWDQVNFQNKNEKQTMSARSAFGLSNGISIVSNYDNHKHILVLATEQQEHDLARYLLLEKSHELSKFMKSCISVFNNFEQSVAA